MPPCSLFPSRLARPSILEGRVASLILLLGILMALTGSVSIAEENIVVQPSSAIEPPSIELRLHGATSSGAVMSYAQDPSSNAMVFRVPAPTDGWQWQYVDTGGDRLRMELKADGSLKLLNRSNAAQIVLKPENAAGLPEITIGNSPVLTQAVADTRYLFPTSGETLLNGSSPQTIKMGPAGGNGQSLTIQAGSGSGSNTYGGNLILNAGQSTGGTGANIFFQTPALSSNPSTAGSMTTRMFINRYGGVGIGAGAGGGLYFEHFGGLDVSYGGGPGTLVLGAEANLTSRNDSQPKVASVVVPHFRSSKMPVTAMVVRSEATANTIDFGAGTGLNSATHFRFWTAPNNETTAGTLRMLIHGNGAIQIGTGAQVTVPNVIAIGANAQVWGTDATAIGVGAKATGPLSFASGAGTTAQGYGQVVLGAFNETKGNTTVDDAQSEILILGSGFQKADGQITRQNALTVKRNGDTEINGSLKVNGVIRVEEAGDLSMGDFKASPQP